MNRSFRMLLWVIAITQGILAIAFMFQIPFFTNLFPLPNTTPLSFIFLGSIFAPACASTLWALLAKEDGALAGIGWDYLAIFIPSTVLGMQLASENSAMLPFTISMVIFIFIGFAIVIQTHNIPIRDKRPMPKWVRISFIIFVIALIIVGGLLIFKTPNILPWVVTLEFGVLAGWFFLGAAAYFTYALLRPSWHNSAGQLIGFLAYDVVLIIPFLQRLPNLAPEFQLSMVIYLVVIIYSGWLSIYYLFIHADTRLWRGLVKPTTP